MLETSSEPTKPRPVFLPSAEAAQARVPGFFEPTIQSSTVGMRTRSWALLDPDVALAMLVLMALSTLVWACGASFQWAPGPVVVCSGLMAGLVLFSTLRHLPTALAKPSVASSPLWVNARATARDWAPLLILIWAFQSLPTYTEVVRKSSVEGALYRLDLDVLGVEPTVWVGHLFHPLLTDWMALAYSLYLAGPLILAWVLAWHGRREDFREMSSAFILQLGVGFFVCLCLPAGPPRLFGFGRSFAIAVLFPVAALFVGCLHFRLRAAFWRPRVPEEASTSLHHLRSPRCIAMSGHCLSAPPLGS